MSIRYLLLATLIPLSIYAHRDDKGRMSKKSEDADVRTVKKYGILSPVFTPVGDGCADLPWPVVKIFHMIQYESICGYSLGHSVAFYDDINIAKEKLRHGQAIVEFSINTYDDIIELIRLYEIADYENFYELQRDKKTVKKGSKPNFKKKEIIYDDLSSGALESLEKSYKERGW
jgi:hypothetical protein